MCTYSDQPRPKELLCSQRRYLRTLLTSASLRPDPSTEFAWGISCSTQQPFTYLGSLQSIVITSSTHITIPPQANFIQFCVIPLLPRKQRFISCSSAPRCETSQHQLPSLQSCLARLEYAPRAWPHDHASTQTEADELSDNYSRITGLQHLQPARRAIS